MSIKEIFDHEAKDFTPWLSNNLNKLGDIINKNLELIETEKSIGPKRLDILVKDEDGNEIAIENQYGVSNFEHLGKIITYGVGSNAKEIIWIAEEFHQLHIDAINWLNKNKENVKYRAISIINPDTNTKKNPDMLSFSASPICYKKVQIGDILDVHNSQDNITITEEILYSIMLYKEKFNKDAIKRTKKTGKNMITGKYIDWIKKKDAGLFKKYFNNFSWY